MEKSNLISQLITVLNKAELYPDSEELADVLWLALQIDIPVIQNKSNSDNEEVISKQENDNKSPPENQNLPEKPPEKSPEIESTKQSQQQKSSLFPHQPHSGINPGGMKGQAFRTPALSLLHNALAFNRAFRPLRKTVASRFHTELDIEETVQYIAETQIFSPILKGKPERWLELVILIDNAISMQIWQPLLKEFRRLLELQGTFAKLHFYQLDTEQETARVLKNQRVIKSFEIINPQQPRLILVVSDCVAKAWHSNQGVFALLQQWSRKHPVSIMQMLPFRLWKGTALGYAEEARFTAALPLALNQALNLDRQDFWFVDDISGLEKGFKIPVLTLEPEIVKTWAKLVLGKQDSWLKGVVFDNPAFLIPPLETAAEKSAVEITAEQIVKQFKSFASPTAQKLAAYLAAVPLDLSVMNVVQKLMLPQSSQVHLAEVFLGGLLKRVPHHAWLEYEFHAGVRELLLDSVIVADAVFVLTRVSDFVEQRFGQSLDFLALLANPNLSDGIELNESTRPFAEVGAKILKRLGGEYEKLVDVLEGKNEINDWNSFLTKKGNVWKIKANDSNIINDIQENTDDSIGLTKVHSTIEIQPKNYVEGVVNSGQVAGRDIHIHHFANFSQEEIIEVDLYHLPKPTTALIGRKTELAQLTEAIKSPHKRLAIIVAAGGIGKSALIDEWLQQISQENYYGKTRVFGWSFYSQGSHNTFTNSQSFFSAVLPFLGISDIPKDEIEKARLLAKCLQQQPCLLILDGLEPLQYGYNLPTMNGELQDSALKEFIACYRQINGKSFVLLSSRQPLEELKKWQLQHYLSLYLSSLPDKDGVALLQALGVHGTLEELKAISRELSGHALSLVLMGHLLSEYHQGDCRYVNELPPLTSAHGDSDADRGSRHALRVLDYYDSLLDTPSRCFLQLSGLFNHPMNSAEKAVLIANAQHAEPLRALTAKQWQAVEQRLEKSGLLLGKKGNFGRLEWDTHPIFRHYFGQKFKVGYPEACKQAHLVLFDYYQKLPEKKFPDTLEEMLPLYRAVLHGCLAGEYQQALKVYRERIYRGDEYYSLKKLGAYSQSLMILAAFFPQGWTQQPIGTDLTQDIQVWLLQDASICLMFLGRLSEALSVRKVSLNLNMQLEYWVSVANDYENYADLSLSLGKINIAKESALQALRYAMQADDKIRQISSYARLATVYYYSGNFREALQFFEQSEKLMNIIGYPLLSSLLGVRYCSYLLNTTNNETDLEKVLKRGISILKIAEEDNQIIDIALAHLNLGQTYQFLQKIEIAVTEFNSAIQAIQQASMIFFMPEFYLARANFYLSQNQLDQTQADLYSAWEIIERCGMKLYAVDYLLVHGHYSLAIADFDTALNHYEEAKQLIEETGYHLRDAELDLFAAKICQSTNQKLNSKNSNYYLQKAKQRIEEIGQWGLLRTYQVIISTKQ